MVAQGIGRTIGLMHPIIALTVALTVVLTVVRRPTHGKHQEVDRCEVVPMTTGMVRLEGVGVLTRAAAMRVPGRTRWECPKVGAAWVDLLSSGCPYSVDGVTRIRANSGLPSNKV